jgi:hypothetical protein
VFENTKPSDNEIQTNFSIKLRMNVNNVPETNLVRPWLDAIINKSLICNDHFKVFLKALDTRSF